MAAPGAAAPSDRELTTNRTLVDCNRFMVYTGYVNATHMQLVGLTPGPPDAQALADFLNLPSVRRGLDPEEGEVASMWSGAGPAGAHREGRVAEASTAMGRLGRVLRGSLRGELGEMPLLDELNAVLSACPVVYNVDEAGLDIRPAEAEHRARLPALKLALLAATTIQSGHWPRLKQCAGCDCVFFDTSRNGLRVWCSMETCGNRAKVHRWRGKNGVRAVNTAAACGCGDECRCGALSTRTGEAFAGGRFGPGVGRARAVEADPNPSGGK